MSEVKTEKRRSPMLNSPTHTFKFFLFSLIGVFMFFVPIKMNGISSIPLDHLVTWLESSFPKIAPVYALFVIFCGAIYPFWKKTWRTTRFDTIFSFLKILGLVVAFLIYFQIGPNWLFAADMGPFLFDKLVIPVGILVPIGAVFLAFLVSYGLLEFTGVLLQPLMRPIWKTPGRSAIDAVASFVGSYSIGLLITNRVYKEGKYSSKEAMIIATGFSTVSATFMIVVAKTLDLMDIWNFYFWSTLLITFLVTAITVRIPPLKNANEHYYKNRRCPEETIRARRFQKAWNEAMLAARQSPAILQNIYDNLRDGFLMAMSILPTILSVGLIGLVLAKYTAVFDIFAYLFYPLTFILQLPEPMLAAKAATIEIAEMFLPALLVAKASLVTKYVIGVVSVSAIIFFSATVPCILSTEIPIKIRQLLLIWLERTVLTLCLAAPVAHIFLS